jgi:hypothetical protein
MYCLPLHIEIAAHCYECRHTCVRHAGARPEIQGTQHWQRGNAFKTLVCNVFAQPTIEGSQKPL